MAMSRPVVYGPYSKKKPRKRREHSSELQDQESSVGSQERRKRRKTSSSILSNTTSQNSTGATSRVANGQPGPPQHNTTTQQNSEHTVDTQEDDYTFFAFENGLPPIFKAPASFFAQSAPKTDNSDPHTENNLNQEQDDEPEWMELVKVAHLLPRPLFKPLE